MALPCTKYPRRIFAIVSTTSILNPAPVITGALWDPMPTGSRLDADHPLSGVLLPRRSTAATPEGRSALSKLPALGAVLNPIVERQIEDAERRFRER
jgi:hypothetical protein